MLDLVFGDRVIYLAKLLKEIFVLFPVPPLA